MIYINSPLDPLLTSHVAFTSSSGMISVGHLTVSLHDDVSTSRWNGEVASEGRPDIPFGVPYEIDLTSVLEGLVDAKLLILSPKELDFFLAIDCRLVLRLIEPNLSRSRTLLRRGEASLKLYAVSGTTLLGTDDVCGLIETVRSMPRSMRMISRTSFSNISLISATWSLALISKSLRQRSSIANCRASSSGTLRSLSRSALLPTRKIGILLRESAVLPCLICACSCLMCWNDFRLLIA